MYSLKYFCISLLRKIWSYFPIVKVLRYRLILLSRLSIVWNCIHDSLNTHSIQFNSSSIALEKLLYNSLILIFCSLRKRVQWQYEPHKMTFGSSEYVEWPKIHQKAKNQTKSLYSQIRVSRRTKTFAKKCEKFRTYFANIFAKIRIFLRKELHEQMQNFANIFAKFLEKEFRENHKFCNWDTKNLWNHLLWELSIWSFIIL